MNAQDKLEFLATDAMRDMRALLDEFAKIRKEFETSKSAAVSNTDRQFSEALTAIKKSVQDVVGVQAGIERAASAQANALLHPLIDRVESVSKALEAKDGLALRHLKRTAETQSAWARNSGLAIMGVVLTIAIVSASSFFAGHVLAQKQVTKNAEWLDSTEGRYALQLRDAGSLKALATCNAGDFKNDWEKRKDGAVCLPKYSDGKVIGWRLTPEN